MTFTEEFFEGQELSRRIFQAVRSLVDSIGPADIRASKSQIAFRRRRSFAWAWMPGRYLRGKPAPLVLTIGLGRHDGSPRWKEVVEPYPGRFIHHLELYSPEEVSEEVRAWLAEAWNCAE
jgi:hypothetical protein